MKGSLRITFGTVFMAAVYAVAWYSETPDYALIVPALLSVALLYSGLCAKQDSAHARQEYIIRKIRGY